MRTGTEVATNTFGEFDGMEDKVGAAVVGDLEGAVQLAGQQPLAELDGGVAQARGVGGFRRLGQAEAAHRHFPEGGNAVRGEAQRSAQRGEQGRVGGRVAPDLHAGFLARRERVGTAHAEVRAVQARDAQAHGALGGVRDEDDLAARAAALEVAETDVRAAGVEPFGEHDGVALLDAPVGGEYVRADAQHAQAASAGGLQLDGADHGSGRACRRETHLHGGGLPGGDVRAGERGADAGAAGDGAREAQRAVRAVEDGEGVADDPVGLADGAEVPFAGIEDRRSLLCKKDRGGQQEAEKQQLASFHPI